MLQGSAARRSVLCVDSNLESQELLAEVLSEHVLTFAKNAFEALSCVNARAFHGYILEYWLPDWSGAALCRDIRKLDPHGPIVFYTAADKEMDRTRALRAGANAYISKPMDCATLRTKLHDFLTRAEMRSVQAKIEEERAVQDELERRLAHAQARVEAAHVLAANSIERTARSRAYRAFIEAGGTRAHFEGWWPEVFGSARTIQDA